MATGGNVRRESEALSFVLELKYQRGLPAMTVHFATTPVLRIAYERWGPVDGAPVILLHGWPDDARTFDGVVPALQAGGFQTVVPWLRGFGPTSDRKSTRLNSSHLG